MHTEDDESVLRGEQISSVGQDGSGTAPAEQAQPSLQVTTLTNHHYPLCFQQTFPQLLEWVPSSRTWTVALEMPCARRTWDNEGVGGWGTTECVTTFVNPTGGDWNIATSRHYGVAGNRAGSVNKAGHRDNDYLTDGQYWLLTDVQGTDASTWETDTCGPDKGGIAGRKARIDTDPGTNSEIIPIAGNPCDGTPIG